MSQEKKTSQSRILILDSAADLFTTKGYRATTMRDIALQAEMKAGSVYYHFESKEEILREIMRIGITQVLTRVQDSLERLGDEASFSDKLFSIIEAHLDCLLNEENSYTSANVRIFRLAPAEVRTGNLPIRDQYEGFWTELLEQAQKKGDLRKDIDLKTLRLLIFGAMNWSLEWYSPKGRKSVGSICQELTDVILNGIRPR